MWLQLGIILLVLLFLRWLFFPSSKFKKINYPPGPFQFPIVGNLPSLGRNPLEKLKQWQKSYGNIVGLRFGEFNMVALFGFDTIKEAYDRMEFAGRPSIGPFQLIAGKKKRGLVFSEGQHWVEQRRFALRNLRDFGFGKQSMEGTIQEDVRELISLLKKEEGVPISTDRKLSLVVVSSLWYIVAGERLAIDDPKAQELLNMFNAFISTTSVSGPVIFMPSIAKLAPKLTGWSRLETTFNIIKSFMNEKIEQHKATRDLSNPRDFIDVHLNEIDATDDPNSSFHKDNGEEHLLIGCINLFAAGAEPTASTLNWSFYLLTKYPEVQRKMQEELDLIVGRKRLPSLEDKPKLIYTEAVMREVFRKSSITPFGVFHNTMEDVEFRRYTIPKNTAVLANLYDVHHDPMTWGDPENFRPERFLTEDGKELTKVKLPLIPFLVGKRTCLGETLARTNFFLILTGVLQRFRISFDPNTPVEENKMGTILRFPPKNKMIFTDRLKN